MITKEKTPPFDLEGYLTDGVEAIVKNALRATLKDPRESAFMRTFLDQLEKRGCKVVFYVEYVPVEAASRDLPPQDPDRELLRQSLDELRQESPDMLFLSFPGDEKTPAAAWLPAGDSSTSTPRAGRSPVPSPPIPTAM